MQSIALEFSRLKLIHMHIGHSMDLMCREIPGIFQQNHRPITSAANCDVRKIHCVHIAHNHRRSGIRRQTSQINIA